MNNFTNFASKAFDIFSKTNSFLYGLIAPKDKIDEKGVRYVFGFRRHFAMLIDMFFIMIVLTFINSTFLFFVPNTKERFEIIQKQKMQVDMKPEEKEEISKYIMMAIFLEITELLIVIFIITYCWVKYAATPGKYICGIRVKDEKTLQNITVKQSIVRFLMSILSFITCMIGIFWSAFDKKARTWHDITAGTVVVLEKSLKNAQKNNNRAEQPA